MQSGGHPIHRSRGNEVENCRRTYTFVDLLMIHGVKVINWTGILKGMQRGRLLIFRLSISNFIIRSKLSALHYEMAKIIENMYSSYLKFNNFAPI